MRAPNSLSFLSKAYNFFKGKTSNNDENSYSKPQNSFQKPCFSPMQCKPMNRKEIPNTSKRNRQVFDDVSNRGWSVTSQGGQKERRATLESLSQRSIVKNVWTSKGDKLVNNVAEQVTSSEKCHKQAEDDEEEGIFTVQVRFDLNFRFYFSFEESWNFFSDKPILRAQMSRYDKV